MLTASSRFGIVGAWAAIRAWATGTPINAVITASRSVRCPRPCITLKRRSSPSGLPGPFGPGHMGKLSRLSPYPENARRMPKLAPRNRNRGTVVAVLVGLVAAVAPSGVAGGRKTPSVPLGQEVGQLIMTGFPGTAPPAWLERRLAGRDLGRVILFGYHVVPNAQ